jgi:hypothetical protein
VFGLQVCGVFEIGDSAGDLEDAVVGAGAESLLRHGSFEQAFAVCGEFAKGADVARRHLGVTVELLARGREAINLLLAGLNDPLADLGRILRLVGRAHFLVVHRRDVYVDIDAVHQRARDFGDVALDHGGGALAVASAVVVESAGLRVLSLLKNN